MCTGPPHRVDIAESRGLLVRIDDLPWGFTGNDSAEDTVIHGMK